MGKYFGTDGIRGTFEGDLVNTDIAHRLGSVLARYLKDTRPNSLLNVVIGRDTRMSGPALCDALTQGLNRHGVYVHDAGIVPTPAIAQSTLEQLADLGIAITASHNPASDNGIKLFNSCGYKFDPESEAVIEQMLEVEPAAPDDLPPPKYYPLDAAAYYINYQRSLLDQDCMREWKLVLDLANGSTCETTPSVFRQWGAELFLLGDNPDGDNINLGVGSEYPQQLGEAVRRFGADLGIAHDGDGDRLVVCDERGELVDGDVLLGIFAVNALRSGTLKRNTLVTTIQSNLGLDHAIRAARGRVERVDVGDRNVASRMREIGANIGGENSGHIIFSDFATTGDGLLAAIKLTELMCQTGKKLSELTAEIVLFPQKTMNVRVAEKKPIETLKRVRGAISKIESDMGDDGRVLVRYSGTEPKLRLLVEGKSERVVQKAMKLLEKAVRMDLDVIEG